MPAKKKPPAKTRSRPRDKTREKSRERGARAESKASDAQPDKAAEKTPTEEIRLGPLLRDDCLFDIDVDDKNELLRSLAEAVALACAYPSAEQIYNSAVERESVVNTYVGSGVAVPHARVSSFEGFAIAVARNADGIPYGVETADPVQLVIFVVGNESLRSEHVRLLAAIANLVKDEKVRQQILEADDVQAVRKILEAGAHTPRRRPRQITKQLLSHARKIARDVGATAILVGIENPEELKLLKRLPRRDSFIVITSSPAIADEAEKLVSRVLRLPPISLRRDALVRVGTLMAVTSGFISRDDTVAFLSGQNSAGLDTITVLAISREFGKFLTASGQISANISATVFERVLTLATELAVQGREGKAVGSIFVIGNPETLAPFCQQLVMNPFRGYPEEERNILDPTLQETIKEFASLDGAFIVREDGVIHSAGTYLKPGPVEDIELPGGLGTRHQAGATITAVENCVAVVLSQSTGQVMLFKKGAVVLTTETRS
jgi:diadenylate cyclase